jgi:hypothetical protein
MYVALTPCAARQAAKADPGQRDNSDELAHYTAYGVNDRILVHHGHAFCLRKGYISDKYDYLTCSGRSTTDSTTTIRRAAANANWSAY